MPTERLQKFLSNAGVASRRNAEKMMLAGRVKVNGKPAKELGIKVDPQRDIIMADGREVRPTNELLYFVLYKPTGYVTTRKDNLGRPTAYDLLPEELRKRLWSAGRLDYDSEGLLVFTNDGDLTQELTHPSFEHKKTYEVTTTAEVSPVHILKLQQGVDIGDGITAPAEVTQISSKTLSITIHEGKNRQVRRMLSTLGYIVTRLVRIGEARLRLGKLKLRPGDLIEIIKDDILKA